MSQPRSAADSRARISTLFSANAGPGYDDWQALSMTNWDLVESPTNDGPEEQTSRSALDPNPGFDPSYPFSPAHPEPAATSEDKFTTRAPKSEEAKSQLQYPYPPPPAGLDVWSPSSQPWERHNSARRPHDSKDLSNSPARFPSTKFRDFARTTSSATSDSKRTSTYSIPIAPPPPEIPTIREEDFSYNPARELAPDYTYDDGSKRSSIARSGTGTIRRLGSRLMSSVNRSSLNRLNTRRKNRDSFLEDGMADGDYTELRGADEEAIGVDISSLGPEFATPAALIAMQQNNFSDDKAYTGTGEVVDLSDLWQRGWEDESDAEIDTIARAGTFENTDKHSYYFPPDRVVPNWKPVSLRTWWLLILILVTTALLVSTELLFQLSDKHKFRGPDSPGPGLFAYENINTLSKLQFAVWKYVPTIIGVVYGIIWKVTDEGVKRGEPYYQLTKGTKGALAAKSLNIEYHTIWSPFVPIEALKHKQYIVVASSTISFFASGLVPIFLSVMIRVHPNQNARKKMIAEAEAKGVTLEDVDITKNLVVDGPFSRVLEISLVFILILACYLTWKLHWRKSGLLWDPSGVAGVAAMANKSHILLDFKDLDLATEEKIHKQLNKRTYILHRGALWHAQRLKESDRDEDAPKALNPHPLLLRQKGMIPFMGYNLFILIMLPLCVYNPAVNVIVDKTPWIITGISIVIKTIWELVEKDMRMLEPWWVLAQGKAPGTVLTLDYTATIPLAIVFKALMNRHFILAWVTTVTLLIEILTVVMGSLDTNGGEESPTSARISFGLAIAILIIELFTCAFVLQKRGKAFLPRQPGTISSVLAFIHQSKMLTDFNGTENKNTAEREEQLRTIGMTYGFGWFIGRDGKRHLGIDHDTDKEDARLLEKYTFGQDPRRAVVDAPLTGWDVYADRPN